MELVDEDAMWNEKDDGSLKLASVNVSVHHIEGGEICTSWCNNTSWYREQDAYAK